LQNHWPPTGNRSRGYLRDWITDVPKEDELKKTFPFPVSPPKITFDSDISSDEECHGTSTAAPHQASTDNNSGVLEVSPKSVSATYNIIICDKNYAFS